MAQHLHEYANGSQSRCRAFWLLISACGLSALLLCLSHQGSGLISSTVSNARLRHRLTIRAEDQLPSGARRPPQVPILFNDDPDSVKKKNDQYIAKLNKTVAEILHNIQPEKATFENTVLRYVEQNQESNRALAAFGVYSTVSGDTKVRDAVSATFSRLEDIYLNEQFYELVKVVYKKQKDDKNLAPESRQLLEAFYDDFTDGALKLPAGSKRQRYVDDAETLGELSQNFSAAILDDQPFFWFTPGELNGTKPDDLQTFEKGKGKNEGKLKVLVQSPNSRSIIGYCTNSTTRRILYVAFENLAPSNVATLKQAIVLRDEIARSFGYPNFAALVVEGNMAKTTVAVNKLLAKIQSKTAAASIEQTKELKELKKNITGRGDYLFDWDRVYYEIILNKQKYHSSAELVKEFFPAIVTLRKVLDLYAGLFSLKFTKIEGKDRDALSPTGKGEDLIWDPDVELYAVWEGQGDGFVGYLYLDLYYRNTKRGSAFTTPIENGYRAHDGSRIYPSVMLATNSKKATNDSDTPSLLYRNDVSNILHEAGHSIHQLVSKTRYARFHGPQGTPYDFLELPSQLMENWIDQPAVIRKLSQHYSYLSEHYADTWKKANKGKPQPSETMPDDIIDSIVKTKKHYSAAETAVQAAYAIYDQQLHNPASHDAAKAIDVTKIYNTLVYNATKVDPPEKFGLKPTHGETTFIQPMGGYEGQYYSYLWSEVYAKDVFYSVFKQDPFSSKNGYRWRKTALEPGGTKDFFEILKTFIGREPNDEAFFKDKGVA